MKKNQVKKLLAMVTATTMCMTMALPVMASSGEVVPVPEGTDVYAGVTVEDETNADARIRVTVPTVFAFVVNGTSTGHAKAGNPVTSSDGTILLPNVKVNVLNEASSTSDYEIEVEGNSAMTFTNYSTKADGSTASGRKGIAVNLSGSIENKGTAASRNYWEHTADAAGFKKYTVSVDGKAFNVASATNTFKMNGTTALAAPNADAAAAVDATTKLAVAGAAKDLAFDVAVGGTRGQYHQVEQSAKVGTIVWTVGYTVDNSTTQTPTSPSNPPLQPLS